MSMLRITTNPSEDVFVLPAYRGQGHGKTLIRAALAADLQDRRLSA